ncbi:bacterial proteasome activator family protein [Nocardioides houyundeii]|uniref:bacterial proteasome activator family protein n=1 Tax=Nocardioides houyundeii TaxID=2045452 RepID=UPI00241132C9|nr:bacterial proteasome activator family protein [Nocardioides houyundeii]
MTESNAVHVEVPEGHVMVVGHDGEPIGTVPAAMVQQATEGEEEARGVTDLVEQPAKVMRIGSMIRQLLEEVKSAPLDEASRARLRDIHHASIKELETGLAPELIEELERIALPFTDDATPSDGELRIAQAQLVGWLEGLFHGIQTAIYAQQMASRAQLEQMRRALPALQAAVEQGRAGVPGQPGHPGQPGQPGQPNQGPAESGGMYL